MLYLLAGYANTNLDGQGAVRNALNVVTTTIPKQKADFGGYYYGIGYKYVFTQHLGIRADYIAINYSSEDSIPLRGNPMHTRLEQEGCSSAYQAFLDKLAQIIRRVSQS